MRFLTFILSLSLAVGCAPIDGESDPATTVPDEDAFRDPASETWSDAPPDDLETWSEPEELETAAASTGPIARECVTAVDDPATGNRWRYRTDRFLSTDSQVRVWVERDERGGATTHFGSIIVHSHPADPHRWDASLTDRSAARVSLWLGSRSNAGRRISTIGVSHRSIGLMARGASGFCTESAGPRCQAGEVAYCSSFAGGCTCGTVQAPVEHTTRSGHRAQIAVVGAVGAGGTVGTAGALALSDGPFPVGDVIAVGFLIYATYYAVVVVPRLDASAGRSTLLEVGRETGGVLMAVDDIIRPVPPYDRAFPEDRRELGAAMMSAMDDALATARNTFECRERNAGEHIRVESAWSMFRALGLTAGNRGAPIRDAVERLLRALEDLIGSADPACGRLESDLLEKLSEVLCRFYAIVRPIMPRDATSPVAIAKAGIESFFARNRFTCR